MAPGTDGVALVTGASGGIGEAAARALLGAGFAVYGTSRKAVAGETRGGVVLLPLDVTDPRPKLRYTAGSGAGRVSMLRRLAPARIFDKQIRKLNQLAAS